MKSNNPLRSFAALTTIAVTSVGLMAPAAVQSASAATNSSSGTKSLLSRSFVKLPVGRVSPQSFMRTLGGSDKRRSSYDDSSVVRAGGHGKVMRVHLSAHTIRTNPGGNNGIVVISKLRHKVNNACLSYDARFDSKFDWSKGGKLPGLLGVAPGVSPSVPAGGHPAGSKGWSGRLMWLGPKIYHTKTRSNTVVSYMYSPKQKSQYGDNVSWGHGFKRGKWMRMKQCFTMNTVGKANGVLAGYINGHRVLNKHNYVFRTRSDVGISHLAWSVFRGGGTMDWASSRAGSIDFDNVKVTTRS